MNQPELFPTPRKVHNFSPEQRHEHDVREIHDPALPAQGFHLNIDSNDATVRYADQLGLRYARQTISQLRDGSGRLPTIQITDHPDFATRGFMLDISRDRVPTRETLQRLVGVLEACRYNHLQLYIEHTFAYIGHDDVWADASPMDPADMQWLRDLCGGSGIELAANQNCFGHFGRWLSHDRYNARAECPDGFEFLPGIPFPPTVLAPTPENASFVDSLVREQVGSFGARIVNIGCDETFELGQGFSANEVARHGRTEVYAQHLRRIIEPLTATGLQVQFWGDVIANHPECLDLIPHENTTALVWNYDAPDCPKVTPPESLRDPLARIGIDLEAATDFASRLAPFSKSGFSHWVCPGTSSWNSLIGRLHNARGNLLDAAQAGVDSGAVGYLVTDWGDGGHHQPLTVSYPPIAYGGAVSWCSNSNKDIDLAAVVDRFLVHDEAGVLGAVLEQIGSVAHRTGVTAANASPLHAALFPGSLTLTNGEPDDDSVTQILDELTDAIEAVATARPIGPQGNDIVEELSVAISLARFGAQNLAQTAGLEVASVGQRASELSDLIGRYRSAWLATSRPGGLTDSLAHLDAALVALQSQADEG